MKRSGPRFELFAHRGGKITAQKNLFFGKFCPTSRIFFESVLLSTLVERFLVSRKPDFIIIYCETSRPMVFVSGENNHTWFPLYLASGANLMNKALLKNIGIYLNMQMFPEKYIPSYKYLLYFEATNIFGYKFFRKQYICHALQCTGPNIKGRPQPKVHLLFVYKVDIEWIS